MDLLYDRAWCEQHGIRYYDLKSPYEGMSAFEIARRFVINATSDNIYIKQIDDTD